MWDPSKIRASSIAICLSSQSHFGRLIRSLDLWRGGGGTGALGAFPFPSLCLCVAEWNVAVLTSGSLGLVITACKAVCLWAELLLRGEVRPHRYIWGGGRQWKAKMMKGKEAEEEREMGQGMWWGDSERRVLWKAVKKRRMFWIAQAPFYHTHQRIRVYTAEKRQESAQRMFGCQLLLKSTPMVFLIYCTTHLSC